MEPFTAIITIVVANTIVEIINIISKSKNNKKEKQNVTQIRQKKVKAIFNIVYLAIVAGITSIFFHAFYNFDQFFLSIYNIIVLLAGGLIYIGTESAILFRLLAQLNDKSFLGFLLKNLHAARLEILTMFPLGYLLIYIYLKNFWVSVLLIPLFVAIYLASKEKVKIIEQTEKTLFTLAQIEDDKFPDTKKHSDRVGNLVKELTSILKLSEDDADIIIKAAKLHDIGKIAIPDRILEKPGRLIKEEWEIIKTHPERGAQIVKELSSFERGVNIILHHHERWDGKGYPNKLKGEEIPLGSRIISLADSFDAMISERPYKPPMTIKEALKEIQKQKGKQFDPKIADKFCTLIEKILSTTKKEEFKKYSPENIKLE